MKALRLTSLSVLLTTAAAAPGYPWYFHVDTSPAPPPDKGPPLSAGALRDKSKLKYEVIGIVGAYVVWILVSLFLIVFVGKRLRRKAQTSNRTLSMEILKTTNVAPAYQVTAGAKSPGKMASLKSWATSGKHSYKYSDATISTIDEKVVGMDRQRNMDEMTNLYAAVMAHDEERSQRARNSNRTTPTTPQSPHYPMNTSHPAHVIPTPPISPQYPPEFQHLRSAVAQAQVATQNFSHPLSPTLADQSVSTSRASTKKGTPLSFTSSKHYRSDSSNSSKHRPGNVSIRDLPISQPLGSADLSQGPHAAEVPLSPRLYNPGPPPPTPGQQRQQKASTSEYVEERPLQAPRRRAPAELDLTSTTKTSATNASNTSLPFRDMYSNYPDGSIRTAPATKTTFVSTRESVLGIHPKTGMPMTPYSPYTPFTPMTPITPRLMTKKEMKKKRKEDGMGVLSEDDMVKSEEDMWS